MSGTFYYHCIYLITNHHIYKFDIAIFIYDPDIMSAHKMSSEARISSQSVQLKVYHFTSISDSLIMSFIFPSFQLVPVNQIPDYLLLVAVDLLIENGTPIILNTQIRNLPHISNSYCLAPSSFP